jgi:hypothetical protein
VANPQIAVADHSALGVRGSTNDLVELLARGGSPTANPPIALRVVTEAADFCSRGDLAVSLKAPRHRIADMVRQGLGVERAGIRNLSHCVDRQLRAPLDYLDETAGVRDRGYGGGLTEGMRGIQPPYLALSMATEILPSLVARLRTGAGKSRGCRGQA